MIPALLFGGLLIAIAASQSGRRRPSRQRQVSAAATRAEQGQATAEDYETLADEAVRQGEPEAAQRLIERAADVAEPSPAPPPVAPEEAAEEPEPAPPEPAPRPQVSPQETPAPAVAPEEAAEEPEPLPPPPPIPSDPSSPEGRAQQLWPDAPTGSNPGLAAQLAPGVAANIRDKRWSFNRPKLKEFQRAAALTPDGKYGPHSRAAMIYYGVYDPPPALHGGSRTEYP